jgi:hypothetical protein
MLKQTGLPIDTAATALDLTAYEQKDFQGKQISRSRKSYHRSEKQKFNARYVKYSRAERRIPKIYSILKINGTELYFGQAGSADSQLKFYLVNFMGCATKKLLKKILMQKIG